MKYIRRSLSLLITLSMLLTMMVVATVQTTALNSDDYRSWTHHDSRWSGTTMGNSTLGNGGAPTTAITKLAVQAGLRDASEFDVGDMATLLTNHNGYSGSAIIWGAPANQSLGLFSQKDVFYDNSAGTSASGKYSDIITNIQQGWHLVIEVKTSSGGKNYVAVDEKLTLASGSTVYIMDCLTNTANNTNIALAKRYSTITKIVGYKGEVSQNSTIDSDYRKWEINNSNWADTVLNGSSTMLNSKVGGGDLVLASTKLAIQAGLWSEETIEGVNSVNRAKSKIANYTPEGVVNDWNDIKTAFGFNSYDNALMGSASNTTATMSTSLAENQATVIGYLNAGYYLAIRVNSSVGWVAVDTEKTLSTGEVYIMRSTADSTKNADIKLSDYYDTMNRVAGFKVEGVQINLSGKADFTAAYTQNGTTSSFKSGGFVPDGAEVNITAEPESGYTAADNWTISGGFSGTHTATTFSFTAAKTTSTVANIVYTPTAKSYDINYVYGTNSASFTYTYVPSAATTGDQVNLEIAPKTDGSFVYELKIVARDTDNNEIPVAHNGTHYVFTMPASDVTVTFSGQNVDDWRRWARDDVRWRDTDMTESTTDVVDSVKDNGAVMIGLTKLAIQAGVKQPTTLTEDKWDINDTVHYLQSNINQTEKAGQLVFNNATAAPIGFSEYKGFLGTDTSTTGSEIRGDLNDGYGNTLVGNLKRGYHQILRISSSASSLDNPNSEWVVIDEEKTLAACGKDYDENGNVQLSDIYIFRATADTNKNAGHTLQEFITETGYSYVWRNYAYLGGTTPARKINYTIKSNDVPVDDEHMGSVVAGYTIEGEETQSFVSGDYVPSRANVRMKYTADAGYFAFESWTTDHTSPTTTLDSTNTANPKEFTVSASDFRTSATVANISCNITPEIYHIYYTDGEHFAYSNTVSEAGYKTSPSFTINPSDGYTVEAASLSFTDADDKPISGLSATKSGRSYTFTMPAQDVYITATATTQSYDDFRAWGVGDSRWSDKIYSANNSENTMNASSRIVGGSDVILAYTKLLIQAGYTPNNITAYDEYNTSTNETHVKSIVDKLNKSTYPYSGGKVLDPSTDSNTSGWGLIANRLGITGGIGTSYCSVGATAGGDRSGAFMYPKLLASSKHKGGDSTFSLTKTVNSTTNAYTKLLLDYLDGTSNRVTVSTFPNSTYDYIVNAHNYKFHLMIYVNSTYGWVAVDEAQSLNTGDIWVWASHNIVSGNNTGAANIVKLSTISTTFERVAGFKFPSGSVYYGSDKVNFTPYLGNSSTNNATLGASYSYLGITYPSSGTYDSGLYVPHVAAVTITRTGLSEHYVPSTDKSYGAWESTDSSVVSSNYSDTSIIFDTTAQNAASSRRNYNVRYYIKATPQVHVKFLGDANGTVNGAGSTLSSATDIYEGDSITLEVTPAANYEVDTITLIKTNSDYNPLSPSVEEGIDPDETSITFDSELTGGETSYFIVQATFKGHGLRITYNFKEYDPSKSGTFEYIEGDTFDEYLTNKTYVVSLDSYDASAANAIEAQVIANAPVLHNVYFNYVLDLESVTSSVASSIHTASVTLTPEIKPYTVTVNGTPIEGTFHFQEEIALEASEYDVDSEDVVWRSGAENGKSGSAVVCYDTIYSFRVTSDLNLTVEQNLTSRDSVDGTSAVVPGYTEVKRVNNIEKCIQNFYVQDFFDVEAPRVYDDSGEVIEDAENVTFLGAGVLFYAYNTDTNSPKKEAFNGVEPTRESVYSVLNNNKNAFLTEATAQGSSFKGSNLNYSYIKASTDNGNILRYSTVTDSYNYFFSASVTNDRTPENQKYVFRVYSFYVCSYTQNGNTYVVPVLSGNYAQAKVYSLPE